MYLYYDALYLWVITQVMTTGDYVHHIAQYGLQQLKKDVTDARGTAFI